MEEEHKNKTLDQLFENARQAEPLLSLEDAGAIISKEKGQKSSSEKEKKLRKNIFRAIVVLCLLLFTKYGYDYFKSSDRKNSPPISNESNKKEVLSGEEPVKSENRSEVEVENTNKNEEQFPPVYQDENISRPISEHKQEGNSGKQLAEKTRTQTDGPATISFIEDEKNIKLTLYFSEVKEMLIDGVKIDPADYVNFTSIISKGRQMEKDSRHEKENTAGLSDLEREQKRQNEIVMNTIIKSLARDGLVSADDHFDFRLQWYKVTIDGKEQSPDVYEKYKALYEEASGKRVMEKSDIHVKH